MRANLTLIIVILLFFSCEIQNDSKIDLRVKRLNFFYENLSSVSNLEGFTQCLSHYQKLVNSFDENDMNFFIQKLMSETTENGRDSVSQIMFLRRDLWSQKLTNTLLAGYTNKRVTALEVCEFYLWIPKGENPPPPNVLTSLIKDFKSKQRSELLEGLVEISRFNSSSLQQLTPLFEEVANDNFNFSRYKQLLARKGLGISTELQMSQD